MPYPGDRIWTNHPDYLSSALTPHSDSKKAEPSKAPSKVGAGLPALRSVRVGVRWSLEVEQALPASHPSQRDAVSEQTSAKDTLVVT